MAKPMLLWLGMFATLQFSCPVYAQDDSAINDVYDRMSRAYAALDPASLPHVFHPDLVTPSLDGQPPVLGGRDMITLVSRGLSRLQETKRKADLRFRITHRSRAGDDFAVDLGVLAMTITDSEGKQRRTYSRFLTVLTRQTGGGWSFIVDAPSPATVADWEMAKRVEGKKFD